MTGLFELSIITFVFTPIVITGFLLLFVWWINTRHNAAIGAAQDGPALILAAATSLIPEERGEWGAAMLAELSQLSTRTSRWRFALNCARVALFPPRLDWRSRDSALELTRHSAICGILSVALPPLGLPIIYLAAVIMEAVGGSPFSASSTWGNPDVMVGVTRVLIVLTWLCFVAGLPLGIAGLVRRERLRALSVIGVFLSPCIIGYVLVAMHFLAGGD